MKERWKNYVMFLIVKLFAFFFLLFKDQKYTHTKMYMVILRKIWFYHCILENVYFRFSLVSKIFLEKKKNLYLNTHESVTDISNFAACQI